MAEWQTRRSQKPLPARACGFDSHLRHPSLRFLVCMGFSGVVTSPWSGVVHASCRADWPADLLLRVARLSRRGCAVSRGSVCCGNECRNRVPPVTEVKMEGRSLYLPRNAGYFAPSCVPTLPTGVPVVGDVRHGSFRGVCWFRGASRRHIDSQYVHDSDVSSIRHHHRTPWEPNT